MGTYGVVVAAVWDLWGSMGCCHCDANLMRINGGVVAAVWDLWESLWLLWLLCGTYGADPWVSEIVVIAVPWV